VVVVSASEERPPALQGIELLPVDCTGRTQLTALRTDLPQRLSDVPGAARIVLPNDQGSLYKFRRAQGGASAAFGLFVVEPRGAARTVLELNGTGPAGNSDPIPEKLALAPDGTALLVATTEAAGGDLWEVDLRNGASINRTAHTDALGFGRGGLCLLRGWGVGVAEQGVYRFERVPTARAKEVDLPVPTRWFGPDVVASADESTVAFLAGDDSSHALVFVCQRAGDASQASERAMRIPGAGFLPEDPSGPALALSTDGSWVAWRAEDSSRECFTHPTRPGSRGPDTHVTGPANFDNTLNDTGVIAFFDPDSAVLVTGRRDSSGISRGDVFRFDLGAQGSLSVSNLSRTSGISQPPFDYGTLATADGLFEVSGAASPSYFMLDRGSRGRLLWVEADGRVVEVLDRVEEIESATTVGSYLVAGIVRPPGVDDPVEDSLNLVQIPTRGQSSIVVKLPNGCHLTRAVGSATHSLFASVLEFDTGERLGRLKVPSPTGVSLSPSLVFYGPAIGLSPDGSVLATVQLGTDEAAFAWSDLGTQLLRIQHGQGFLLPGL
jgi:hypothetical protein